MAMDYPSYDEPSDSTHLVPSLLFRLGLAVVREVLDDIFESPFTLSLSEILIIMRSDDVQEICIPLLINEIRS